MSDSLSQLNLNIKATPARSSEIKTQIQNLVLSLSRSNDKTKTILDIMIYSMEWVENFIELEGQDKKQVVMYILSNVMSLRGEAMSNMITSMIFGFIDLLCMSSKGEIKINIKNACEKCSAFCFK